MKEVLILLVSLSLVLFILSGGCTQNSNPAPSTTTVVTTPPQTQPAATTSSCSLVPGPTQTVPDYESVSVTVDRNSITESPTISVIFNGGQGLGMVEQMNATVIHPDCTTDQGIRDNPVMGETITLDGTTTTDRVIVVMTMTSGDQYTIIDNDYPFPR